MSNRLIASLTASLFSLAIVASSAAQAQTACTSKADEDAFQVGALKSVLTVLAIGCKTEESYNGFVEKFRPELVAKDSVVSAWFKRNYGSAAQRNYDAYITLLANEDSEAAQREGGDYCPRLLPMFKEVMSLPSASVLAEYAEAKDVVPATVGACEGPSRAVAVPAARVSRAASAKKK